MKGVSCVRACDTPAHMTVCACGACVCVCVCVCVYVKYHKLSLVRPLVHVNRVRHYSDTSDTFARHMFTIRTLCRFIQIITH
jgi:hypothetical protein